MNVSHYRILKKIGEGAMGEVYLAQDTSLNRYVAVKFLPQHFTRDNERLQRFHREAQVASVLNHPNVLTIHEVDKQGDTHFIVSEYVDGENLRERLQKGAMTISESLDVAIGIAEALNAAHEYWIVHRDIKPENVMIRRDGYVKVLDFGLAKLTEPKILQGGKQQFETTPGMVPGTMLYVAPERLKGEAADPRSDLFSLGVILFEMIDGDSPFNAGSVVGVMDAVVNHDPPRLKAQNGENVPEELERIVLRLLAKDPAARYQTAAELLPELRDLRMVLAYDETQRRRKARTEGQSRSE